MAKPTQDHELSQMNLFPHDPAVKNLGIVDVKLRGGVLDISMSAATEATDLAMINPKEWAQACAEWLVRLTGGIGDKADLMVAKAYSDYCSEAAAREADAAIGFAKNRNGDTVVTFEGVDARKNKVIRN